MNSNSTNTVPDDFSGSITVRYGFPNNIVLVINFLLISSATSPMISQVTLTTARNKFSHSITIRNKFSIKIKHSQLVKEVQFNMFNFQS